MRVNKKELFLLGIPVLTAHCSAVYFIYQTMLTSIGLGFFWAIVYLFVFLGIYGMSEM